MVWISPMTFADGSVLTAAQLNTFLRDDMLETDVGRSTTAGSYFVSVTANLIAERRFVKARVNTFESTASTSYVDLATTGPAVTVRTGINALVFIACSMVNDTPNRGMQADFSISGATNREPGIWRPGSTNADGLLANDGVRFASHTYLEDLTPGENTFTMKYRAGAGTPDFGYRVIGVMPM